jgi:4-amino-4-deoxychorismate lyase
MSTSETALINGAEAVSVDLTDRGFQYGDGVFTTLRIAGRRPLLLALHLDRLASDAERLRIPFPGHAVLAAESKLLAEANGDGVLKIMLTRGSGGRGYRIPAEVHATRVLRWHPLPEYPEEAAAHGVRARFCNTTLGINPALAGIKHLNRLEQVLARMEWDEEDIREGLLCDNEGFVVEGVMSNLFLRMGGRLLTPKLDRCGVRGVMRTHVLRLAAAEGLIVDEGRFRPESILAADELFLTNSVIGLWPIRELEGRAFAVGRLTRWMMARIADTLLEEATCPA